ncbi:MAG: hypothetical protein JO139_04030 [Alphaproteobacteria bacterium]|nr:hypothetical protein [Alphaproteobacteria bacterium]
MNLALRRLRIRPRVMHFFGMLAIAGFLAVHIALAMLVPSTLVAMVLGRTSGHRAQGTEASGDA